MGAWTPLERFVRRTLSIVLVYVPISLAAALCAILSFVIYRPILKLLSIKLLVFFTAWQGIGLHFMSKYFHVFRDVSARSETQWSEMQICEGVLNGLLIGEMFV